MSRRRTLFRFRAIGVLPIAALVLAVAAGGPSAAETAISVGPAEPTCADTVDATGISGDQATPAIGSPCWTSVDPYPFGTEGGPVNTASGRCKLTSEGEARPGCFLTVTSLAFRAWNRGLAATSGSSSFGVWLWNGARWFPDPTFPGSATCRGDTIIWAGKLDYWLVGAGSGVAWPSICRFDGSQYLWQPLRLPAATLARVTDVNGVRKPGGVTTGSCLAWNDCWFFGLYGTRIHWDGKTLVDQSPGENQGWLWAEVNDAVIRTDARGNSFGVAVGSTSGRTATDPPLPPGPGNAAPPQLFAFGGESWAPTPFSPPTAAQAGDPFRTDLVAVGFDPSGTGWSAGVPQGRRAVYAGFDLNPTNGRPRTDSPEPSPLVALTPGGLDPTCPGPPADRFVYGPRGTGAPDSFLWADISAVPGTTGAVAGGQFRPAEKDSPGQRNLAAPEPVVVQVGCAGDVTTVRFVTRDPTEPGAAPLVPANRLGTVRAVAANAPNDAWVSTGVGALQRPDDPTPFAQPPHLYRFTDGRDPQAPAGDDAEIRPLVLQQDPPIFVFAPLPPPPPPPPPVVTTTRESRSRTLPAAIFRIRVEVKKLNLEVSFRVRRKLTLGLAATRQGGVVASTGLRTFRKGPARLSLRLDPKRWPTGIAFLTSDPRAVLKNPGPVLRGTISLKATATAIKGRKVASVRFEYARAGKTNWAKIATDPRAPFGARFDTRSVPDGFYDLRAVVTDTKKASTASEVVKRVRFRNGSAAAPKGYLTVFVSVVNGAGSTATASDFTLTVAGGRPTPGSFPGSPTGTRVEMTAGSPYQVTAQPVARYTATYSGDCAGTLTFGAAKTCSVTLTDTSSATGS